MINTKYKWIKSKYPNFWVQEDSQGYNSTNTQGLIGTDYSNAIALLSDVDNYQYNIISTPGLYYQGYGTQVNSIINNTIARGDATIDYFDGLGKYAEKEDYTEFLKDVYITRIAKLMNPQDDTGRLILPVKKSLNEQMNKLK